MYQLYFPRLHVPFSQCQRHRPLISRLAFATRSTPRKYQGVTCHLHDMPLRMICICGHASSPFQDGLQQNVITLLVCDPLFLLPFPTPLHASSTRAHLYLRFCCRQSALCTDARVCSYAIARQYIVFRKLRYTLGAFLRARL